MDIHFTARRFKAHREVRDYALDAIKKLDKYYDGIVRSDIILSFERRLNSIKTAEIIIRAGRTVLSATEKSEEFIKSIDLAIGKLERQLDKYKTKIRRKDKKAIRNVKGK